jgi:hypothetical protein
MNWNRLPLMMAENAAAGQALDARDCNAKAARRRILAAAIAHNKKRRLPG